MDILGSARRERIMAPLDLGEEKVLRFYVGDSFYDVTFSGDFAWYLHRLLTGAWPGLYGRLESQILSLASHTLNTLPAAPRRSPDREGAGIEWVGDYAIDWNNSTIDPRFFGWPAESTGIVSAESGSLRSPIARYGDWLPLYGARSYDRDLESHIRAASTLDVGATDYQQADLGETIKRRIVWQYEPAASILSTQDEGVLKVAGFDPTDINMNLENVWNLGLRSRRDCVIQYGNAVETLRISTIVNQRETIRLDAGVNRFRQIVRRLNVAGERYGVELPVVVRNTIWDVWPY